MTPSTQRRAVDRPARAVDDQGGGRPLPRGYLPLLLTVFLVGTANVLAVSSYRLPFLGPALGFWFLAVHPAYLAYTTPIWRTTSVPERLGYSVTATLLMLMAGGLAINTVL